LSVDALSILVEKDAIFQLIRTTAARLDEEALDGWLALFANEARYEIKTYGPEIKAGMSWWHSNRDELENILSEVKQHVRDPGQRLHLVTPISIEFLNERATSLSHFSIVHTDTEGNSKIYAAGRYDDTFIKQDSQWLYEKHCVVLDTRKLEPFTHLPL